MDALDPTIVERLLLRDVDERRGRALSERSRQVQRSLENYMKAAVRPRWMERLIEVERGIARARRELEDAYRALERECSGDRAAFAARWRTVAESRRFEALNELIRTHNQWYPVERDLPMNPRTGDFTQTSFRRREIDAAWVLEHFPAR